jgi:hypothetical protein
MSVILFGVLDILVVERVAPGVSTATTTVFFHGIADDGALSGLAFQFSNICLPYPQFPLGNERIITGDILFDPPQFTVVDQLLRRQAEPQVKKFLVRFFKLFLQISGAEAAYIFEIHVATPY